LSRRRTIILAPLPLALTAILLSGCSSGLSSSSTCKDFLNAPQSDQAAIVSKLAGQYNKPDYATPLGAPEVPYYCASNPSVTLGDFFQRAG
jgi:hypothetical protein